MASIKRHRKNEKNRSTDPNGDGRIPTGTHGSRRGVGSRRPVGPRMLGRSGGRSGGRADGRTGGRTVGRTADGARARRARQDCGGDFFNTSAQSKLVHGTKLAYALKLLNALENLTALKNLTWSNAVPGSYAGGSVGRSVGRTVGAHGRIPRGIRIPRGPSDPTGCRTVASHEWNPHFNVVFSNRKLQLT